MHLTAVIILLRLYLIIFFICMILGEISYFYMKGILLKLAELMTLASKDNSDTKNVSVCGKTLVS